MKVKKDLKNVTITLDYKKASFLLSILKFYTMLKTPETEIEKLAEDLYEEVLNAEIEF